MPISGRARLHLQDAPNGVQDRVRWRLTGTPRRLGQDESYIDSADLIDGSTYIDDINQIDETSDRRQQHLTTTYQAE